jgi:hypothetical protein
MGRASDLSGVCGGYDPFATDQDSAGGSTGPGIEPRNRHPRPASSMRESGSLSTVIEILGGHHVHDQVRDSRCNKLL